MAVTDYAEQRKAIEGHFNTNFSASPIGYDNVDVLSDGTVPTSQDFVRVSLRGKFRQRISFGAAARNFIHGGTVLVQIYTAKDQGSEAANDLCDSLDTLFDLGLTNYEFGDPVRGGVVPQEGDQYIQSMYSVGYRVH